MSFTSGAYAEVVNDPAGNAAGGIANYYDSTNQYPNVAAILGSGGSSFCTGTLLNSRTVLTAAHCFYDTNSNYDGAAGQSVSFKPVASNDPAVDPNTRGVTSIKVNAGFSSGSGTWKNDIAVISLARPITTLTPVTLYTAAPGASDFPQSGITVMTVGYGAAGLGTDVSGNYVSDNKRRVVTTTLAGYLPGNTIVDAATWGGLNARCNGATCLVETSGNSFFYAQFRNPGSPNNPNYFSLTTTPGATEGGPGKGDSGGPLLAIINGRVVEIGVLNAGSAPGVADPAYSGYGAVNQWMPFNAYLDWLAQNNPLRSVAAKAGTFNWSNAAAWTDSVPGVAAASPNNTVGDVANFATDVARYYQVTIGNPGTITVDTSPSVDTVSIAGAQSQLVLPTGSTLTAEVSTTVSAGTLTLAGGTLATPVLSLTGGFVQGTGSLTGSATSVTTAFANSGGILAPLGLITIAGTYAQTGGGTLQFRAGSAGSSDAVTVSGAATLGGTLRAAVQPGLYATTTNYSAILTSASMSGQFATLASSSPFFSAAATYGATTVDVTLTRKPFGAVAGLTANQQAVGNALERSYATTLTGNAATLYSNLLGATSTDVLTQLSGSNTAVTQAASLSGGSMFMTMMLDQGATWRSGDVAAGGAPAPVAIGYAAETRTRGHDAFAAVKSEPAARLGGWRAWTSAFGAIQGLSSNDGASASQSIGGGAIGADYQLNPTTLAGFTVGASTNAFSAGNTSGSATAGHVGVYGMHTFAPFYVAATLSYSRANNSTSRSIVGIGPTETAKGSFSSDQLGGRVELGRRFVVGGYGVTPFVAIQYSTVWQRGYSETSTTAAGAPGVLALTYQPTATSSLPGFLGVQLDQRLLIGEKLWSPYLRMSWVHEFKPTSQITAAVASVKMVENQLG